MPLSAVLRFAFMIAPLAVAACPRYVIPGSSADAGADADAGACAPLECASQQCGEAGCVPPCTTPSPVGGVCAFEDYPSNFQWCACDDGLVCVDFGNDTPSSPAITGSCQRAGDPYTSCNPDGGPACNNDLECVPGVDLLVVGGNVCFYTSDVDGQCVPDAPPANDACKQGLACIENGGATSECAAGTCAGDPECGARCGADQPQACSRALECKNIDGSADGGVATCLPRFVGASCALCRDVGLTCVDDGTDAGSCGDATPRADGEPCALDADCVHPSCIVVTGVGKRCAPG